MAPAKPKDQSETILAELATISAKLSKLDPLPDKLDAMESLLAKLSEENATLKKEIHLRDEEIAGLHHRLNAVEQYNQSWSIRINNLTFPPEDESNPKKVMEAVYHKLVLPILTGALQKGAIEAIPTLHEAIETAHILPGKPNSPKPIIARFTSRHLKQTLFSFKKDFSPKIPSSSSSSSSSSPSSTRGPRMLFPFYEDLTRDNFLKMKALAADQRVTACWSVGGQLRFRLSNSPEVVRRVKSVYDSVDKILSNL
jgi:hypothetical protein